MASLGQRAVAANSAPRNAGALTGNDADALKMNEYALSPSGSSALRTLTVRLTLRTAMDWTVAAAAAEAAAQSERKESDLLVPANADDAHR